MTTRTITCAILLLGLSLRSALACDVAPTDAARVTEVVDAVTFELSDGRTLRLEGLGSPRAPSRYNSQREGPWRMMEEATERTRAIIGGDLLGIAPTDALDRYGRVIAQAFLDDGRWLNGALVSEGLARVETARDQRRCAGEALALEARARDARRGMWRLSAYQVRNALEASAFTNDFQIVEGLVISTAEVRGRIYVNFGEDWRTDFTVTIAPGDVRRFAGPAGFEPLSLTGQHIRARGWLEWYNGPMIEADHPEQIELLGPGGTAGQDEGDAQ